MVNTNWFDLLLRKRSSICRLHLSFQYRRNNNLLLTLTDSPLIQTRNHTPLSSAFLAKQCGSQIETDQGLRTILLQNNSLHLAWLSFSISGCFDWLSNSPFAHNPRLSVPCRSTRRRWCRGCGPLRSLPCSACSPSCSSPSSMTWSSPTTSSWCSAGQSSASSLSTGGPLCTRCTWSCPTWPSWRTSPTCAWVQWPPCMPPLRTLWRDPGPLRRIVRCLRCPWTRRFRAYKPCV